jgi:type VI secretion system secreted protein VgrG
MNDVVGFTQAGYRFAVTTPLGADKLLLDSFEITEGISEPFEMRRTMASEYGDLDFGQIVGKAVTVMGTDDQSRKSHFHGIVGRFRQDGMIYTAQIRPKLWKLTLTSDNRIFQHETTPDIVTAVLQEHGVTDLRNALTATYKSREYCVQYNETAFNFVSRPMQ